MAFAWSQSLDSAVVGLGRQNRDFIIAGHTALGPHRDGGLQGPPVLEHFPSSAQPGWAEEVGSTGEEEHTASNSPALDSGPQSAHS